MAWEQVRSNKGAPGIDGVTVEDFPYTFRECWPEIRSAILEGRYAPSAVLRVEIPKADGKSTRPLGIPTVLDRVIQQAIAQVMTPIFDPGFSESSCGFRPGRSAHDGVKRVQGFIKKGYKMAVDCDLSKFFDNIDHEMLMQAVKHHTDCKWLILYIERWLKAPFQLKNGELVERSSGTPQGGVISPLLANLFLHYVFDKWMVRENPHNPWARYADDGIAHCRSLPEAENLLGKLDERFKECNLELHPDKTQIVYCKDDDRKGDYPVIKFDFLGYTFRPRRSKNKYGKHFINFTPAVSNAAQKAMRQKIHDWRMHLKPDKDLEELSRIFNPVIQGWMNYYGNFYRSAMSPVLRHFNNALVHWARRKYKKLSRHRRRAEHWLGRIARREPKLFIHWRKGILPSAG